MAEHDQDCAIVCALPRRDARSYTHERAAERLKLLSWLEISLLPVSNWLRLCLVKVILFVGVDLLMLFRAGFC